MSKARNLSKVIVDSSGIVDRDSLDVETVAKTGSYNDLTNKPTIPSGTVTSVAASAGTGISVSGSPITSSGTITITNTAPDQTVALTAGTGISTSGTYPNFTITNSAPDQTVALTQGGTTTITGTYPNFTISSADQYVGTVTSVAATVPTGLSVSGTPVTSSGTLAITYAAGYSIPTDTKQSNWDTAYGWGNHASAGYALDNAVVKLTGDQTVAGTKTFSSTITGSITGNAGTVTDGVVTTGSYANPSWITSLSETKVLPSQTGNSGKYLTTNGTSTSWETITANPSLDDLSDVTITSVASGQVLSYNGTAWVNSAASSGGQYFGSATTKAIAYNAQTIGENVTVTTGNNGLSAGPITISSGYTVTVESGANWVVV